MAIKVVISFVSLLLVTVLFAQCKSTSEKWQTVNYYDALLANKPVEQNLSLGPDGYYTVTPTGCYVTTVNSTSFESQHPTLFQTFTAVMKSSTDVAFAPGSHDAACSRLEGVGKSASILACIHVAASMTDLTLCMMTALIFINVKAADLYFNQSLKAGDYHGECVGNVVHEYKVLMAL